MTIRQRDLADHRHPSRRKERAGSGRLSGRPERPGWSHMNVLRPLLAGLAAAPFAASLILILA